MAIRSLSDLTDASNCPLLVVKIGSALLVDADGLARADWLEELVGELADLRAAGQAIVIVSSGAIALGAGRLDLPPREQRNLADAQAAASVGQVMLARLWADALERHDIIAAQILVTLDDLEDRRRYLNASATLARLLAAGAMPIINENDSVATTEIRFGDNDRLAARVAQAAGADGGLLLSDVDGLYDRHPQENGAQLLRVVGGVDARIAAMADDAGGTALGSGGMAAKLQAAQIAQRAGIALAIVNGSYRAPIGQAIATDTGTLFLPTRLDGARKAWLGGRLAPNGAVTIDAGCGEALARGGSVLAAGVVRIDGDFTRGDLVSIIGIDGNAVAQGLIEYDAVQSRAIAGLRAEQQADALGHPPRAAMIHRDHLVML